MGYFLVLGATGRQERTVFSTASKAPEGVRKQFAAEHFLPFVYFKATQFCSVLCHLVAATLYYSLL